MPHALFIDKGGGVVNAVPIAELIELLLVDQRLHKLQIDIGRYHVGGESGQIFGNGGEVVVPAAQDKDLLGGKLLGHLGDAAQHHLRVVVVLPHPVVDDVAAVTGPRGVHTVGNGLHAIGLMKGPGHAVNINVGSQQQRDKIMFHRFALP